MNKWTLKECLCERPSICFQCGLCCTWISGIKLVPRVVDGILLPQNDIVPDCPYLLPNNTCWVYSLRQKYPERFGCCHNFPEGQRSFIQKLALYILRPQGDDVYRFLSLWRQWAFVWLENTLHQYFDQEGTWFLVDLYKLVLQLEEKGFSLTDRQEYFRHLYLFSYISQRILLRLVVLMSPRISMILGGWDTSHV